MIPELSVGKTFKFEGQSLKVVKATHYCKGCIFKQEDGDCRFTGNNTNCISDTRKDNENVIYVEASEQNTISSYEEALRDKLAIVYMEKIEIGTFDEASIEITKEKIKDAYQFADLFLNVRKNVD